MFKACIQIIGLGCQSYGYGTTNKQIKNRINFKAPANQKVKWFDFTGFGKFSKK